MLEGSEVSMLACMGVGVVKSRLQVGTHTLCCQCYMYLCLDAHKACLCFPAYYDIVMCIHVHVYMCMYTGTCTCTCIHVHSTNLRNLHVHVDCIPFRRMVSFSGISKSVPGRTRTIIRLHNVHVPGSVVWTKKTSCLSVC